MSNSLQSYGLNLPGSGVHGILQARILEWVAMPSSRTSTLPSAKMTAKAEKGPPLQGLKLPGTHHHEEESVEPGMTLRAGNPQGQPGRSSQLIIHLQTEDPQHQVRELKSHLYNLGAENSPV